jgi:Zn-dependent peptidase ImmA (M78 family)
MIKELLRGVIGQEEILNYYNATITYIDMPITIRGCVHYYKGMYDILINEKLSYYKRKKTIIHELAHIELSQLEQINNDLFAFYIDKYEDKANRYIEKLIND